MTKSGKHVHHGPSSGEISDVKLVLSTIGLKKGDIFLYNCSGDENMSLAASEIVWDEVNVYAIDVWEESTYNFKGEIEKENIENIESIFANITLKILKTR